MDPDTVDAPMTAPVFDPKATVCAKCRHAFGYAARDKCGASPWPDYVTGCVRYLPCLLKNDGKCKEFDPLPPKRSAWKRLKEFLSLFDQVAPDFPGTREDYK
jgi:hypothetical protein